jgi:hypothetical protein
MWIGISNFGWKIVKNPLQDRCFWFPEQADIPSWHDVPAKSVEKNTLEPL